MDETSDRAAVRIAVGRLLRDARGPWVAQSEAASWIGVSQSTYWRLEAGQYRAYGADEIVEISGRLGRLSRSYTPPHVQDARDALKGIADAIRTALAGQELDND